ncbi:Ig-like domain-containing protein [uncultured Jatrophihabitans sp.]|uniref:L,D-transpeptidase n=1 Tax=uncultured Jatrophihabitans sp. TaxID=1610747 RepID=UPI0035CA5F36
MHRVPNSDRSPSRRRISLAGATTACFAALALLAGCTGGGAGDSTGTPTGSATPTSTGGSSSAPAPVALAAVITTSPQGDGKKISPAKPVTVSIANGKLTSVTMTSPSGKAVKGVVSPDGASWHNTEVLGYSKTYSISATGANGDGKPVTKRETITTVTPDNMTMPYLQRIGGYPLGHGATYGVAIVPIVHFDEPIGNETAAQKALTVTTTPHVDGSWYWSDSQNVHWRPQHYWASGTKVTVTAKVYGKKLGDGLYGQADTSASFTIGRRQVTIAHDTAPKSVNKVKVYNAAGHLIRTMNTSMGEHSGVSVKGNYINFYTLDGTYTVLAHEQPAKMCSASYGLPANAPGGYACENIYNATKISTDGIYLHELLTTIYAQDNGYDVSHGCLNLNAANSMWFFKHSMIGDPVEIKGAKHAPTLQVDQGGDWTVPWSKWLKGSAL